MKSKQLTKEQLFEKDEESFQMLVGIKPYIKTTKAEPTNEQFKEIRHHYDVQMIRSPLKGDDLSKLYKHYCRLIFNLKPNHPSNWEKFWVGVGEYNNANEKPSRDPRIKKNKIDDLIYEYVRKHTLISLEMADLVVKRKRHLLENCPYILKVFSEAIRNDDLVFLKRVGDVLRKRQLTAEYFQEPYSSLQSFLLCHWVKEIDDVPPLYNLSMTELLNLCVKKIDNKSLTIDVVEKTKQRLGLLSFRKGSPK